MKRFLTLLTVFVLFFAPWNCALSLDNLKDISKDNLNIVLITIDTLRADHLSCYGYKRKTSPQIDKIAEKGILFKNAIAPSSWTVPSMVSLFTSVYPINHEVIHGFVISQTVYKQEVFSNKLTTLAEILKKHGYTTFGVASNLHLSEKFGFARGFDYFKCLPFLPALSVNNTIYSWKDKIEQSHKFFLWAHYFDPHDPYHSNPPWVNRYTPKALTKKLNLSKKPITELSKLIPTFKKYPKALSNLIALYDSEINYTDSYIGKLIQKFELDKNTLIIITSDHGEEFLEHGYLGHARNLYQETIHIPLIIKLPNSSKKETFNKQVNLTDIMPTILHMLNIDPPKQTLGKSFWKKRRPLSWFKEMLLGKDTLAHNFSELDRNAILKAIMTPEWKYIYNYQDKNDQLYNLASDPLELYNLANKKTKQRNKLKKQLFKWVSHSEKYPTKSQPFKLSPKEKEKLKGLGYIQ